MRYLRAILVRLKTGSARHAGTDDPLYLGVSGRAGGREFPLDSPWFDDFERVSEVKYVLGELRDEVALAGARRSRYADKDWNDPGIFYVGFDEIDRVYLRKAAGRSRSRDDAYQLDEVEVALYGDAAEPRVFHSATAIWLGVEYGLQVWIPERERSGPLGR